MPNEMYSRDLLAKTNENTTDGPKDPPVGLLLNLSLTDPEVVAELQKIPEGDERERYATAALRLGVLSLRMASGHLDAETIQVAGRDLMANMKELLGTRANELTTELATTLTRYFDPESGMVTQRINSLVRKDGDLERMLESHFGTDESALARTLARHIGKESPIFKMLSPTDANGLRVQIETSIGKALDDQKNHVLREFSLDNKESALSRLVNEITTLQGGLKTDVAGKIELLAKEFSLDEENSALSRLVNKVETAGNNLSLDNEKSALSRLKRELKESIEDLVIRNSNFHTEVRETLAELKTRRKEEQRSPQHGLTFEARLGELLTTEAQRTGDIHEAAGTQTGAIKNCKVGDFVTHLGPESSAPGARFVWEAKDARGYDLKKALKELELARKNRQSQLGIFVLSAQAAPEDLWPFGRYGNNLVIVWDADDPSTDYLVRIAASVARALVIRERSAETQGHEALHDIEVATRTIEKQISHLDKIEAMAKTVQNNGEKIGIRAKKMRSDLQKEVDLLDRRIRELKEE